jgi:hypothetical protein
MKYSHQIDYTQPVEITRCNPDNQADRWRGNYGINRRKIIGRRWKGQKENE